MLTLQFQNQVFCNLMQFTSTLTQRSPLASKVKKVERTVKETDDILCQASFREAAKNCIKSSEAQKIFKASPLTGSITIRQKAIDKLLQEVTNDSSLHSAFKSKNGRFSSSYLIKENKVLYPDINLVSTISLQFGRKKGFLVYSTRLLDNVVQVRGFKTERNKRAEELRNPSASVKFKQWLPFFKDKNSAKTKETLEKLNVLLKELETDTAERSNIKRAFAEGYIAGQEKLAPSNFGKFFNALRLSFWIGMVVLYIYFFNAFTSFVAKQPFSMNKDINVENVNVTFDDVRGVDEAKQELQEIVHFLKNPDKFCALGGKLPRGSLLVGPPGTGKTLLARAVAGEAGVPFFYAAGSSFDEIFVGQGAKKIRELFAVAKEKAPCVIFLDEIDSVGGKRATSTLHPYANQTVNQLLAEMDGFHQKDGVIVLGATNKIENLDRALLRPGRFDVKIRVEYPDYIGRKDILTLYLSKILSGPLDMDILARRMIGCTGADIANIVNQAALKAALDEATCVSMEHLLNAADKVQFGPEKRSSSETQKSYRTTAFHESGHTIVAIYTKDATPVHKVTIIPRANSLGHTMRLPEKNVHSLRTKSQILAEIDVLMGGRVAEEFIFGSDDITTGASDDLSKATDLAEMMVKRAGMSEKYGKRTIDGDSEGTLSQNTREISDNEIKRILQESYDRAKALLKTHSNDLHKLAEALLAYETLSSEDVKDVLEGKIPAVATKIKAKKLNTDFHHSPMDTQTPTPIVP